MEKSMRLQFYFSIAKKALYLGLVILALIIFIKLAKRVGGIIGAASRMAPTAAGQGPQGAAAGYALPAGAGDLSSLNNLDPETAAHVISAMITAEGAKRG
jgi:hypothetical protein